jgi:hypothetical protein
MSGNSIAICLYIGIMLMAGTVLVLTVIYFVRPNPEKKKEPVDVGIKPINKKKKITFPSIKMKFLKKKKVESIIADSKPVRIKKNRFPVIKLELKKSIKAAVGKLQFRRKAKDVMPVVASVMPESRDKAAAGALQKPENKVEPTAVVVEAKKPENKAVTAVKPAVVAITEKKEIKTEVKLAVPPEQEKKQSLRRRRRPQKVKNRNCRY